MVTDLYSTVFSDDDPLDVLAAKLRHPSAHGRVEVLLSEFRESYSVQDRQGREMELAGIAEFQKCLGREVGVLKDALAEIFMLSDDSAVHDVVVAALTPVDVSVICCGVAPQITRQQYGYSQDDERVVEGFVG